MNKTVYILGNVLFLLCYCKPETKLPEKTSQQQEIQVVQDSLYQTRHYSLKDSSGSYSIQVFLSDINKGILRYNYQGSNPLVQQIKPMYRLFQSVFSDSSININFHTLHWGAIGNSATGDYSMSIRLALAAAQSDKWNKVSGNPLRGHENAFVQNIANSQNIYSELKDLFKTLGYKIEISGVEKVFIQQASKLPFWANISKQVDSHDKLPYDCQTWFRIQKDTL